MEKEDRSKLRKDDLEIQKMKLPLFKKMTKEEHICYVWGYAEGRSRGSSQANLIWILFIVITLMITFMF